jgi:hypothetical protein
LLDNCKNAFASVAGFLHEVLQAKLMYYCDKALQAETLVFEIASARYVSNK